MGSESVELGPTAGPTGERTDDERETMRRVVENLEGEYGVPVNERELDTLVETILSQQNSSASTRKVFAELKGIPLGS